MLSLVTRRERTVCIGKPLELLTVVPWKGQAPSAGSSRSAIRGALPKDQERRLKSYSTASTIMDIETVKEHSSGTVQNLRPNAIATGLKEEDEGLAEAYFSGRKAAATNWELEAWKGV
eukprot:GHVU01186641.1.p3 GENE.GHVU01186641.1~~GHVU01186641.1.p3  ORF type:complete len:118 (+),score=12.15 GHVU01186641.1:548-901(+)